METEESLPFTLPRGIENWDACMPTFSFLESLESSFPCVLLVQGNPANFLASEISKEETCLQSFRKSHHTSQQIDWGWLTRDSSAALHSFSSRRTLSFVSPTTLLVTKTTKPVEYFSNHERPGKLTYQNLSSFAPGLWKFNIFLSPCLLSLL